MMETDPNEALQRVAAQDGSARELEVLAANVVRALLDGWQPEVEGLHRAEAARAGYLIELAATSWATDQQGRLQPLIDALAQRRGEQPMAATFYPGEPAAQSGHDELAQKWGLLTGARLAELRNMIEQDPLLSGLPCFLDFEASGLRMPDSYPIEVAWSLPHATVEAYLITPVDAWTDWDPVAEREIHGITRADLRAHGYSVRWIAERMNDRLAGQEVYCDGGDHDWHWYARLYHAAGLRPAFRLGSIDALWNKLAPQLAAPRGPHYETGFDLLRENVRQQTPGLREHRAGDDVRRHLAMYRALTRISQGEAPFDE